VWCIDCHRSCGDCSARVLTYPGFLVSLTPISRTVEEQKQTYLPGKEFTLASNAFDDFRNSVTI